MIITQNYLKEQINISLDKSQEIWNQVGNLFLAEAENRTFTKAETNTLIPGHPTLTEDKAEVSDFVALVLDMRNSTEHLLQRISDKVASASQLERVLYETTAINTAGSIIVNSNGGRITEFLGDGYLALFRVENTSAPIEVYSAHRTANECLTLALPIINKILHERYGLPALQIGIGMAFSKAIVTLVGHGDKLHPKAIGECVYRASKLSDGVNKITIDNALRLLWPKAENGSLRFVQSNRRKDVEGYDITRSK